MSKSRTMVIGLDIGSVSVDSVVLDIHKNLIYNNYKRHFGQPLEVAIEALEKIFEKISTDLIESVAVTGSGGRMISDILKVPFINEIISVVQGIGELYPDIKTVIELGGEDSKLLNIDHDKTGPVLKDFAMNSVCAAGTGSFLDQQSSRLNINIDTEFGEMALKSDNPPRIAGRCSVFAKSDMIHLQQIGTPDYDIVAGLCFAVARNFKSTIAKGKNVTKPIVFAGGVAANKGMIRAFNEIFRLEEGELVIPENYNCLGAIGAAMISINEKQKYGAPNINLLKEFDKSSRKKESNLLPLALEKSEVIKSESCFDDTIKDKIPAFIGIDIGSVSTNVVVIDKDKRVLARRYLPTAGRPIEAVRQGLEEIGGEVGDKIEVKGVGTTGSGRYMIADLVGADIVKNEITAQARATIDFDKTADTIFEIGGQDSKYISIENGVVVDFEMNKVCAAGTGSFLEEQAEKLEINIKKQFENLALSCNRPSKFGERCTVFIESDLVSTQQAGAAKEELVSGLAYSIVKNYLNRVVGKKKIGNNIYFQGGTANNLSVVSAFEKVLNKKITVPPQNDVTGAIGIGTIARDFIDANKDAKSTFKGFDFSKRKYEVKSFVCNACSNMCEVRRVKFENEKPLFYGHRCEKYDFGEKKSLGGHLPDLFTEREKLLMGGYYDKWSKDEEPPPEKPRTGKPRVGIPRFLQFYDNFPFWKTFFEQIGFEIILSDRTSKEIIHSGTEYVTAEFCFPVKVAFGHYLNILKKDIDAVFLPSIITVPKENSKFSNSYNCPFVQSMPYTLQSNIRNNGKAIKILEPHLEFLRGGNHIEKEMIRILKPFKIKTMQVKRALQLAEEAQKNFADACIKRGREIIEKLEKDQNLLILVGRPYNTCDEMLNMELPKKLKEMGILAFPMDFLDLSKEEVWKNHPNMYWRYGQRILAAGEVIKRNRNMFGVYITNFGCGPDSMIMHAFRDSHGNKPFLQLELDEHSADAGVITRCEAYLDSLEGNVFKKFKYPGGMPNPAVPPKVKLYIPFMSDHAIPMAAAFRNCGMDAEVLPQTTEETADLGRQFTSGKECFPCICTTGDIINKIKSSDFDRGRSGFFMPTATGPCRFGQYRTLQSIALKEFGYEDIPLISPDSKNSYKDLGDVDEGFSRQAWKAMLATDILEKMLHETRPYELNKGETDNVYQECLILLEKSFEQGKDEVETLHECRKKMKNIPVDKSYIKPAISIVGEIYLRLNKFGNGDLIRQIEELGGEIWLAPMAEWILYTNNRYIINTKNDRDFKNLAAGWLKDRVQRKDEHKIYDVFKDDLRYNHDVPVKEVLKNSAPYMHQSFGGEAILSVGKAIDMVKSGAKGVINVMPFTCMPGSVVTAVSKVVSENNGEIPWINISYDGQQDDTSIRTRLEAFMFQAKAIHDRNNGLFKE